MTETTEKKISKESEDLNSKCKKELQNNPEALIMAFGVDSAMNIQKLLNDLLKDKHPTDTLTVQEIQENVCQKAMAQAFKKGSLLNRILK